MKMIGLIGGLGPESTLDYYRRIVERYAELAAGRAPALVITNMDVRTLLARVAAEDFAGLADSLVTEVERLSRAGSAFAAIAANTPHIVFDRVAERSPLPLVSIVEATRDFARMRGFRRLGLLGTRFTMKASFYADAFRKADMAIVVPQAEEMEFVHAAYVSELLSGTFSPQTRDRIGRIVERLRREDGVDAVVLAGTELPLLMRGCTYARVPLLDTTEIHVARIVATALE